jgi:hypothetical protein
MLVPRRGKVRIGRGRRQPNRRFHGTRRRLPVQHVQSARTERLEIGERDLRPGSGEGRIQRDRLLAFGNCHSNCLRSMFTGAQLFTTQISRICLRVVRQFRGELLTCSVAERHVERVRDLGRDICLHVEHIRQRGIERLVPPRHAAARVDQFRAHAYAARCAWTSFPSNRAGQDVIDAELVADPLGRLRCTGILARTDACDHFEALHCRELSANFVRHSVREIGVGGIALILERNDDGGRGGAQARARRTPVECSIKSLDSTSRPLLNLGDRYGVANDWLLGATGRSCFTSRAR